MAYNYDDNMMTPERDAYSMPADRAAFISRTYSHLMGAIVAFVGIEVALFQSGIAERIAVTVLGSGGFAWLLFLGAFMVVGWMFSKMAMGAVSKGAQYLALGGYVLAEALIFVPLLWMADTFAPGTIGSAGTITLLAFAGLTGIAFITRKDFSFLRGILMFGGVLALVAILGGVIFGFQLGLWFSVAMVGLAGASILYDTSNIIHHYPTDRHVAASLSLFASVALMFWYVLQILISLQQD